MTENTCDVCDSTVDNEIVSALSDVEGVSCESCLESVKTHPQLESLIDEIAESLTPPRDEMYRDGSTTDQILFAVHCINEGIVDGGSPGFHHELRKYTTYLNHQHSSD